MRFSQQPREHDLPFASVAKVVSGGLAVLLLAASGFAQDSAAAARMAAGCGPDEVQFEAKADKKQHPSGKVESGKALVYVFEDEDDVNAGLSYPGQTTRVGLDGFWVGANYRKSYFFFSVDPGNHRLCTSQQSMHKSTIRTTAAASFTAEADKIYYFHTKTPDRPRANHEVELVSVDAAAGQLLVAASAFSTSHPKK